MADVADGLEFSADLGVNDSTSPVENADAASVEQPAATPPEQHVPYQRFKEVNDERRQFSEELARAKAEADLLNRQIQALTGVKPTAQVDPQEQAIRASLEKLYPGLQRLDKLPVDKLLELVDQVPKIQQQTEAQQKAHFASLADATMASLHGEAAKTLFDGKALSPEQKRSLQRDFIGWLEDDPTRASRYLARDAQLIPEYLKAFASTMLDPVRRQASVTLGQRVARTASVPTGGASAPAAVLPHQRAGGGLEAAIDAAADELFRRGA